MRCVPRGSLPDRSAGLVAGQPQGTPQPPLPTAGSRLASGTPPRGDTACGPPLTPATPRTKPLRPTATVNITVARSAYTPAPPKPLAGLGKGLILALFTIVAAIWLTLIAQIWRVRRVRLSNQEPEASKTYHRPSRVGA